MAFERLKINELIAWTMKVVIERKDGYNLLLLVDDL